MIAGILAALTHTATWGALGYLAGDSIGAAVGAGIGLILGVVFGYAVASSGSYRSSALNVWRFIVDCTWSLPNTVAGTIYLAAHLLVGHSLDRNLAAGSGRVSVTEGVISGFATTIGNVVAGADPTNQRHEDSHITQARILGPLYIPLIMANYVLWTVLPLWLLWNDHRTSPINTFRRYFMVGVYPNVWNEAISYGWFGGARPR